MFRALEFFAGSGLVRLGLSHDFKTVWANDVSEKKRCTYIANHGDTCFDLADIRTVGAGKLPEADLAWASFPCQDLSLAGNMIGMAEGTRSGLFWEWMRLLWDLRRMGRLPSVLVAENVVGFLIADEGKHFAEAYSALRELGYRVGSVVIDASFFLPQSRPRAFVIAVRDGIDLRGVSQAAPSAPFHTQAVIRAAEAINDPNWVWWSLPTPSGGRPDFSSICEKDSPWDSGEKTEFLCSLLSPAHHERLEKIRRTQSTFAGTAYRRTRPDGSGKSVQRFEIRFDGVAGCLRTPDGGSSRQTAVFVQSGVIRSRLLTVRECARLMGAPDSFRLPGTYNDAYRAMGDGVAVPVTRWLSGHLLKILASRATGTDIQEVVEADAASSVAYVDSTLFSRNGASLEI